LTTPGGILHSLSKSTKIVIVLGTLSLGLITYVFPHVIAIGNIQRGIIAGKLNGHTPAQTPSGTL